MLATIIPATKTKNGTGSFTYAIPDELKDKAKVGSLVNIPLGKRKIQGIVSDLDVAKNQTFILKEISGVNDNFLLPKSYFKIADWISKYYCCSIGESISLFLPPNLKRPRLREKTEEKNAIKKIELNIEQKEIFDFLKHELTSPQKPALIHGVTGSGKTEIYIELTREALILGKQVIVLVPEIILTPQTVERFQDVFGDEVSLMHSNLSASEKYQCFSEFHNGKKRIIIGPRSALLIPSNKIGLIIIDEEQEDAYKQEQNPRYHAVTLAEKIALETKALLVLGSATPRIETYFKAKNADYDLFTLEKRYGERKMPSTKLIDLRNEIKYGNFSPISTDLQKALSEILAGKRQALLFLNRRGTATFVSCRDCGFVKLCKNCCIPLIYHTNDKSGTLSCHHCGHKEKVLVTCPECGSTKIKYFGAGIDKIEKEIREIFPEARVIKIDSTTVKSKLDYEKFYRMIKDHKVDFVIGTQIIAKGLDIENVDLVGIVSADTGLHMPHYRASEKTFQILTQVSGRSGRGSKPGKTIIQTYWPESEAIVSAFSHDYLGFYKQEILEREKFSYPPFCHLVRIIAEDKNEGKALIKINELKKFLDDLNLTFIGPGPCFYSKLHNRYRYHIIIKIPKLPSDIIGKISGKFDDLVFDVDPSNLL